MRAGVRRRTTAHIGRLFATLVGCSVPVFHSVVAGVHFCDAGVEANRAARRGGGAGGAGGGLVDPIAPELPVPVHFAAVPAVPVEDRHHCLGFRGGSCGSRVSELGFCL